jgi:hypothetical protein
MKILYAQQEYEAGKHKIYYAVYDNDWFKFSHTTNIPLDIMEIDEIAPDNKAICQDLVKTRGKTDKSGESKYHIEIENNEPVIYEKEGWVEYLEDD